MNLTPDDPRLTAHILGELPAEESALIETVAAADPGFRAEIEAIRQFQNQLSANLSLPAEKLLPAQREKILAAALTAGRPAKRRLTIASLQPYFIPAAAAAVLAIATFIYIRMSAANAPAVAANPPSAKHSAPVKTAPQPPPAPAAIPVTPTLTGGGIRVAAEFPTLSLPVLPGDAGYTRIAKTIRDDVKLPPPGEVRIEEILNHFSFRLTGTAAIARTAAAPWHPDNRDNGMTRHLATLATEVIPCPWKPSANLVLITLRGGAGADSAIQLTYRADPKNVTRYRLVGYAPDPKSTASGEIPSNLPAGATTTLALEIQSLDPRAALGELEWTADANPAPPIRLIRPAGAEPSDDARFAALACTFAQWLAKDPASAIDADILAALARENASAGQPAPRSDFLHLIDRALRLR